MACPLRVVTDPRGGQGLGGELWRRELEATGDFRGRGGNPEKGAPLEPFPEILASPARSAGNPVEKMTMADIGSLLPDGEGFKGKLRTLSHKLRLELQPNEDKRGEGSPDFIVYADEGGDMVEIGAAWQRTVQARGGNNGRRFLSITLDDPSFPAPLNVAAFAPDEGGLPWPISWNRPRQQGREAA